MKKEVEKLKAKLNLSSIKKQIESKISKTKFSKSEQILNQRPKIPELKHGKVHKNWIKTGIPGFDELLETGIPEETSILISGSPGSGKTIFCLQTIVNLAKQGKKCLYMTFEEDPENLKEHMRDFGWNPDLLEKKETLKIIKFSTFEVSRQVEAMLEKAKGELLIDVKPILFPQKYSPDIIVIDSLSAIGASFLGKEDVYRIYIEQLFDLLRKSKVTSFLISETVDVITKLSSGGVEEFMADGVIVLYNIRSENVRESAIEVLKLRGTKHKKKIVAMQITDKGIVIYPEQEVFGKV